MGGAPCAPHAGSEPVPLAHLLAPDKLVSLLSEALVLLQRQAVGGPVLAVQLGIHLRVRSRGPEEVEAAVHWAGLYPARPLPRTFPSCARSADRLVVACTSTASADTGRRRRMRSSRSPSFASSAPRLACASCSFSWTSCVIAWWKRGWEGWVCVHPRPGLCGVRPAARRLVPPPW